MVTNSLVSLVVILGVVALVTPFLGRYIATVLEGERHPLARPAGPSGARHLPRGRRGPGPRAGLARVRRRPAACSACCPSLALYLLQRLQGVAAAQPDGAGAVPEDLALNTAVSFVTNTNWQNYAGETTMAHLTQAAGPRGPELRLGGGRAGGRHRAGARPRPAGRAAPSATSGRTSSARTLYVLLPIAFVAALVLVWQGVPQTFGGPADGHHAPGRHQTDLPRPDRLTGGDQGAGHQRRRHRQRQLRPPVREPHRRSPTCSSSCSSW